MCNINIHYTRARGNGHIGPTMPMDNQKPGSSLTNEALRDLVMEHVLANFDTFMSTDTNLADRFVSLMNSMNELAGSVAVAAVANRVNLSPATEKDLLFLANPETDTGDNQPYELRFRLVEKKNGEKTGRDEIYPIAKAIEHFGEQFVADHWGLLGENCPKVVPVAAGQDVWFTAIRYPLGGLDDHHEKAANPKLG